MKKAIEVKTFEVKIWMGLMEGYTGPVHNILEAQEICMNYVNDVKLCVTLSPTKFIYVDGNEPGVVVGLIQYPRFLMSEKEITEKAIDLARIMMKEFKQFRCSVVASDKTYMLENEEL